MDVDPESRLAELNIEREYYQEEYWKAMSEAMFAKNALAKVMNEMKAYYEQRHRLQS